MGLYIEDGTGSGLYTGVTPKNRLQTTGVVASESNWQTQFGLGFTYTSALVGQALVNLPNAAENAIFYARNDSNEDLVFSMMRYFAGEAVGAAASGVNIFRMYRNPTGGTIISAGTPGLVTNRDHGSSRTSGLFTRVGGGGFTSTGGDLTGVVAIVPQVASAQLELGEVILRPGNSLSITSQPPILNTGQNVLVQGICFIRQEQLI